MINTFFLCKHKNMQTQNKEGHILKIYLFICCSILNTYLITHCSITLQQMEKAFTVSTEVSLWTGVRPMLVCATSRFYLDNLPGRTKETLQDINDIHPLLNQHWHWLSHKYDTNAKISRLFKSQGSSLHSKTGIQSCYCWLWI